MTLHSTDTTLYALFCLRRHTLPVHTGTLRKLTGRNTSQTVLDLLQLEGLGLVNANATVVRLTMLGLARAAQLSRASGDALQHEPLANTRKALRRVKPPLAARPAHAAHAAHDDADRSPKALSA